MGSQVRIMCILHDNTRVDISIADLFYLFLGRMAAVFSGMELCFFSFSLSYVICEVFIGMCGFVYFVGTHGVIKSFIVYVLCPEKTSDLRTNTKRLRT